MLRSSTRYLTIVIINFFLLIGLLLLWTDKFELTFDQGVREIELFKIFGFTMASFGALYLVPLLLRKKSVADTSLTIKLAVLVTFLASSYLYVDYISKTIRNRFVNQQLRESIMRKVQPAKQMAYGTKADGLSLNEYELIAKKRGFPKLPGAAKNISYVDAYDGFLPDYWFTIAYDVPKEVKIDTFSVEKDDFIRQQTIQVLDSTARITYYELEH